MWQEKFCVDGATPHISQPFEPKSCSASCIDCCPERHATCGPRSFCLLPLASWTSYSPSSWELDSPVFPVRHCNLRFHHATMMQATLSADAMSLKPRRIHCAIVTFLPDFTTCRYSGAQAAAAIAVLLQSQSSAFFSVCWPPR